MFGLKIIVNLLLLHENREHKSSTEEQNLPRALGLFAFHSANNSNTQEAWGLFPRDPTSTRKPKGYEEEQDLVVLQGAAQPHDGDQEQERAHADDPRHHPDAGDQAEPFPPGRHAHQQQTHQLRRKETEGDSVGTGGGGSSISHLSTGSLHTRDKQLEGGCCTPAGWRCSCWGKN